MVCWISQKPSRGAFDLVQEYPILKRTVAPFQLWFFSNQCCHPVGAIYSCFGPQYMDLVPGATFSFLKVEVESYTQGCHLVGEFLEVHGCMYLDIWTEVVKPYRWLCAWESFNFSKIWKRKQHSGMLFSWSIFWSTWTHVLGHLSRSGWIYRCSTSNLVLALTLRKVVSRFPGKQHHLSWKLLWKSDAWTSAAVHAFMHYFGWPRRVKLPQNAFTTIWKDPLIGSI